MPPKVKICGIRTIEAAIAAINDSADFLGFIHFPKSPRHLTLNAMKNLIQAIRSVNANIPCVSVVVNPDDSLLSDLKNTVRPDLIQLHGKETPARAAQIADLTHIPLIKAVSVSEKGDLDGISAYEPHVEYMMFDAKTPKEADLPGGLGLSFDWSIMQGYSGAKPWFLAGGLSVENVAEAVRLSGAPMLDVSSGVESAPGVKDNGLISGFLKAAKSL
ncbi:phosphoribosylanthranilate isomerase [Asticcacaulis sp.]|uniref:phosphoribosylanthranilate isomerase n=1 Tax=Asticcacaulis sp. TaxID=1872648 RepID=UPI002B8713D1|nr:phosphoribosylanthranilate isomerase [Asticcacaulis sp.]HTM80566.1 phosphoribosylanthranilate isomerase [Asticcacaulis sp.]